jgi:pectinesterase
MAGKTKEDEKIWFYPQDARFYEYGSTGPGAVRSTSRWVISDVEAQHYIPAEVLEGWEPET